MVRPTNRFSASWIASDHVARAAVLPLIKIAAVGPLELGGVDAVAEEPRQLLVDARDDLLDVDGVIDREDHQGGVGIERVGGEHRLRGVGEPAFLAESVGDPGRQAPPPRT